jgi:hypothetical protein
MYFPNLYLALFFLFSSTAVLHIKELFGREEAVPCGLLVPFFVGDLYIL